MRRGHAFKLSQGRLSRFDISHRAFPAFSIVDAADAVVKKLPRDGLPLNSLSVSADALSPEYVPFPFQPLMPSGDTFVEAGRPWAVTRAELPQIRTCAH